MRIGYAYLLRLLGLLMLLLGAKGVTIHEIYVKMSMVQCIVILTNTMNFYRPLVLLNSASKISYSDAFYQIMKK